MINGSFEKTLADFPALYDGFTTSVVCENLPKKNGDVMLCMEGGERILRAYADGTYAAEVDFSLSIRVSGNDSQTVLNTVSLLEATGAYYKTATLPVFGGSVTPISIRMTAYPFLADRSNNGDDEYKAVYTVKYLNGGFVNGI